MLAKGEWTRHSPAREWAEQAQAEAVSLQCGWCGQNYQHVCFEKLRLIGEGYLLKGA